MINSDLPIWFKIWWVVNIILACAFFIYWFLIDDISNYHLAGFFKSGTTKSLILLIVVFIKGKKFLCVFLESIWITIGLY